MSIERCVEELYGKTLDEKCKEEEIARLKAEQGIQELEEPAVNLTARDFEVSLEGENTGEGKSGKKTVPDEPGKVPGTAGSGKGAGSDGSVRTGKE